MADYPETLQPSKATCVRSSTISDARNAFIDLTAFYALSERTDGIWGVANPQVSLIEVEVADGVISVHPTDGVFFLAIDAAADRTELTIHGMSESPIRCVPDQPLRDLFIFCE